MKLYIDTNTYTSYISLTSDIKSLQKLKKLLVDKKIELILPSQTKEEFLKHYKERVEKAKKKLKEPATQFELPNELKSKRKDTYTTTESQIVERINILNSELKKLITKRDIELKKHLETVEKIIKDIFKLAVFCQDNEEIVLKAVVRFAKGLPPKKENAKYGDAIIWETLKSFIKTDELVIVSADPDFSEPVKKGKPAKINSILKDEWKKHTKKNLLLYSLLGQFVNSIEKEDPVSSESIKKEAAQSESIQPYITNSNLALGNSTYIYPNQHNYNLKTSDVLVDNPRLIENIVTSKLNLDSTIPVWNDGTSLSAFKNKDLANLLLYGAEANALTKAHSFCQRCGKVLVLDSPRLTISNLCEDCSKYFSI